MDQEELEDTVALPLSGSSEGPVVRPPQQTTGNVKPQGGDRVAETTDKEAGSAAS